MKSFWQTKRHVLVWVGLILSIYIFYIGMFRGECMRMRTSDPDLEEHYFHCRSTQYAFGKAISTREWWEPGPPPIEPKSYICDAQVTWRGLGLLWRRTGHLL